MPLPEKQRSLYLRALICGLWGKSAAVSLFSVTGVQTSIIFENGRYKNHEKANVGIPSDRHAIGHIRWAHGCVFLSLQRTGFRKRANRKCFTVQRPFVKGRVGRGFALRISHCGIFDRSCIGHIYCTPKTTGLASGSKKPKAMRKIKKLPVIIKVRSGSCTKKITRRSFYEHK